LTLVVAYSANGRVVSSEDTVATSMLPLTILRGEGVYLDRFELVLREPDGSLPVFVTLSRGHILSRYPVAPALMAVPLTAPQVALLDRVVPGWDRNPWLAFNECKWIAKRSMALLVALTAVILHRLLLGLGLGRVAVPAVLAAALGSDLWVVGSQALWQHGPAALALVCGVVLLDDRRASRERLVLAGLAAVLLLACRLIDVLFGVAMVAWVARIKPRGLAWFLPLPVLGTIALLSYNLWFFGSILGGQAQLEQMHPRIHGLPDAWSGQFVDGAAGTLLSPNRGLLVFCPWVAVALVTTCVPAGARRLASHRLICWQLVMLVPYFILLANYAVWWGGHCFGPRYWTDVAPLFAVLLAFGLDWARTRSRALVVLAVITVSVAIGIQTLGACCYPTDWNLRPTNVDLHHERLWDWRDSELSRCLRTALSPASRGVALPRLRTRHEAGSGSVSMAPVAPSCNSSRPSNKITCTRVDFASAWKGSVGRRAPSVCRIS
jgi:hypothetical protein